MKVPLWGWISLGVVVSAGVATHAPGRVQHWLQARAAFERQVNVDAVTIASLTRSSALLQHQNDSLRAAAGRVDTITRVLRAHLTPATALPDTCRPALAARDSVIALQDSGLALRDSRLANDSTVQARDLATVALLRRDLDSARTLVATAPVTPTFWQKITPELRWGPAVLVAPDGSVHGGLAVVASFRLPV